MVGSSQHSINLALSLPVTSDLFCLRHFKGKIWVVEREVFASPAVLCDLCDWRVVVVHLFIPAGAGEFWRGLTMEELVLGRNMQGVWCSDPARLLFQLLFHLVQHLEERVSQL